MTAPPFLFPLPDWITVKSIKLGSTCVQEDRKSVVEETDNNTRSLTFGCILLVSAMPHEEGSHAMIYINSDRTEAEMDCACCICNNNSGPSSQLDSSTLDMTNPSSACYTSLPARPLETFHSSSLFQPASQLLSAVDTRYAPDLPSSPIPHFSVQTKGLSHPLVLAYNPSRYTDTAWTQRPLRCPPSVTYPRLPGLQHTLYGSYR